ncbi:MAG: YDG domain-containing protein [Clostridiaceae bacterium]
MNLRNIYNNSDGVIGKRALGGRTVKKRGILAQKLKHRGLSIMLTFAMLACLLLVTTIPASAAYTAEYNIESGNVSISSSGSYRIYGTSNQTAYTITVGGSITADITLDGVNISASGCAFSISTGSTVNLTLTNSNTLLSSSGYAGLQVPSGASLTITETSTGSLSASSASSSSNTAGAGIGGGNGSGCGTIKIYGGTITAAGGSSGTYAGGAGIGGDGGINDSYVGKSGGTIEIRNAAVTASGGNGGKYSGGGAGIGGGGGSCYYSNYSYIGGGNGGSGGIITIDSGTVRATGGQGGYLSDGMAGSGAGIGGGGASRYGSTSGISGGSGGNITINGGTVIATGNCSYINGGGGAGIGGGGAYTLNGYGGNGGTILITGGNITAAGGAGGAETSKTPYGGSGAGIGGGGAGYNSSSGGGGGIVTITGGYVTATGGTSNSSYGRGTGIGGGTGAFNSSTSATGTSSGDAAELTISGGTVIASSGSNTGYYSYPQAPASTGIGAGYGSNSDGTCTIDGGSVYASSMESAVVNGSNASLYRNTITMFGISAKTDVTYTVDSGTSPVSCSTDATGKLYLWLPVSSSTAVNITKAGTSYNTYYKADCAVTTTASSNVFTAREKAAVTATAVNSNYDGSSKTGYTATVARSSGTDITASVASSLNVAYYSGSTVDASKLLTVAPSDAGEYTAVIALSSTYYYSDPVTVQFTINKLDGLSLTSDAPFIAAGAGQASVMTYSLDLSDLTFNQTNTGTVSYALGTVSDSSGILSEAPSLSGSIVTVKVNASLTKELTATVPITISTANYNDISTTLIITAADKTTLTLSGISISDKEYDGAAILPTGTLTFTDTNNNPVEISDPVYLYTGTGGTSYSSKTAPSDAGSYTLTISVPSGNSTYSGSMALNFTISPKELTITGLSAADKEYDGTSAVTVSGTAALSGVVSGDTVTLAGSPTFSFADSAIESNKTVSLSEQYSISGADIGNYMLAQPSLTASITKIQITITPNSNLTKVYGEDDPVIGYTYAGSLLGTDTLSGTLSYDGAGAGEHTISIGSVAITGNSDYYNPVIADVKFTIEQKTLTVTEAAVNSKTYDGTTAAGVAFLTLNGIVSSDDVTASGTASFSSADAGEKTSVDLTGIVLSGTSSVNYTVSSTASNITPASAVYINKATPTVTLTAVNTSASGTDNKVGDTVVLTATVTGISGYTPTGTITFTAETESGPVSLSSDGSATFTWSSTPSGSFDLTAEYSGDSNYDTATGTINNFDVTKYTQDALVISDVPDSVTYGDKITITVSGGSGSGAISWSSSQGLDKTGDYTCYVTFNSVGTAAITVKKAADDTYNEISKLISINALQAMPTITEAPQAGSIFTGSKLSLSSLTGGSATGVSGEPLTGTYSWSNPDATLTSSSENSVTFTPDNANYKAVTVMVNVTVSAKPVTGVSLNKSTLSLQAGSSAETLTATIAPVDATNTNVTWSSSNESVATVSNGVVTPVSAGTATITVTTEDGGFAATCAVTVSNASSGGSYSEGSLPTKYTVSATAASNGTVTLSAASVNKGGSVSVTITPNAGYRIADVLINGVSIGAVSTYTLTNVGENISVQVVFEKSEDDETWQNPYSDVGDSAWYHDAVRYVSQIGLMNGDGEHFNPDADMTRAMIVTVLFRLGGDSGSYENTFSDVASGAWYEQAVAWASANGISNGIGSSSFAPDNALSREQLAVMLYNYARYKGLDVTVADSGVLNAYTDADSVSSWAEDAMKWAVSLGIISGDGTGLDPQGNATRAQIAVMLQRFVENVVG